MPKFNTNSNEMEFEDDPGFVGDAIEKSQGKGKRNFAAAVGNAMAREDRQSYEKAIARMAPTGVDEATGIEYLQGRISEPRCHVCQHPYRAWIETMLIRGQSYKGLQERIPPIEGHGKLDRRGISNHHKKHMDLQDAALRAILEREADLQSQDYKEGLDDAITKRGVLEVMLRKGYDDILSGVTTVEARDLIQLAKLLAEMDSNQNMVAVDELRAQVQIFIQAIKNVCPPEMQNIIAQEVRKLRGRENIEAQYEEAITEPAQITATVEYEEITDASIIESSDSD